MHVYANNKIIGKTVCIKAVLKSKLFSYTFFKFIFVRKCIRLTFALIKKLYYFLCRQEIPVNVVKVGVLNRICRRGRVGKKKVFPFLKQQSLITEVVLHLSYNDCSIKNHFNNPVFKHQV